MKEELIVNIVMVISMFWSIFWLVANVTGTPLLKMLFKFIAIVGITLPMVYLILKYLIIE